MKLKELFEKDIKIIPGKTEAEFGRMKQASRGLKDIGGGVQGTAYKLPHIPGTIIKTAKVKNPETDGYVTFVKLVLDHQDNPFFPKIYNAVIRKLSVTEKGNPFELIIQMERLHKLSSTELYEIAPQLFKRLGIDIPRDDLGNIRALFDYPEQRMEMAAKTKNPQFAEALNVLEPLFNKFSTQDLHSGNWMIRLTSVGPQLVIIDPFFSP